MEKQYKKSEILELTQNGLLFYKFVIPDLIIQVNKCKNTRNPFYEDSNPSLSIYRNDKDGIWYFKDHGDDEFLGDVFKFASLFYELNLKLDFKTILKLMSEIDYSKLINSKTNSALKYSKTKRIENIEVFKVFKKIRGFTESELDYFSKFGITERVLEDNKVFSINGYTQTFKNGSKIEVECKKDEFVFAYEFNGGYKIYRPFALKKDKFRYLGKKPDFYIFGDTHFGYDNDYDIIFLTAGEKDVMTIQSMGYTAFCLSSENAKIDKEIVEKITRDPYNLFFSLYDYDETGRKRTKDLFLENGIMPFEIPEKFRKKGKDISDFIYNRCLTSKDFHNLVEEYKKKYEKGVLELSYKIDDEVVEESESDLLVKNDLELLPELLKECLSNFDSLEEKNLLLISCLTVLGSVFQNVFGIYDQEEGTNLYCFIIAPAASGKSKMNNARILVEKIHKQIIEDSSETNLKTLFIPADSSIASIQNRLKNNEGKGLMFETEADQLSDSLEKGWSNFSTILRKGFHGEDLSVSRGRENEYFEISNVYLSVLLSGTPNQVKRLFVNTENGLFSRFIFFNLNSDLNWDKTLHIKNKNNNVKVNFKIIGDKIFNLYKKQFEFDKILIYLSDEQFEIFHGFFDEMNNACIKESNINFIPNLRRMGVITFKIIMILSILRTDEDEGHLNEEIKCDNNDLFLGLKIAKMLLKHSLKVFKSLQYSQDTITIKSEIVKKFYEELPLEFDRKEWVKIANGLDIIIKTAENYISNFLKNGLLTKERHNCYVKTKSNFSTK